MRKIYLLLEGEYDCYEIIAAYSTESKAKKAYKEMMTKKTASYFIKNIEIK